jgi:DNA-binding transcriptional regulator YiaG
MCGKKGPKTACDLREMNEKQFVELFNHLKARTRNFKELSPDLILENSRYLLVLRLCLSLSQKEFGRRLGVTKDWVRHTEAGRNKILHLKPANRYVDKINSLLNQTQITLERTLENWKRYKFARDQDLPNIEVKIKTLSRMDESDFKSYFDLVSRETNGFTRFDPQLLMKMPQSILIFRVALGINHRKYASMLGINSRRVRAYEHLEMQMKLTTAIKLMKKIRMLFVGRKIAFADALENFRWLRGIYGRGKLSSYIERGLKFAERVPLNSLENKIKELLENSGVPFEAHARIKGLKRDYIADFVIPNTSDPKVIVEVTKVTLPSRKKRNIRSFICLIDHKFQVIKAQYSTITTVLALQCVGFPRHVKHAREMLQLETLNTDLYALNEDEFKNLIHKIKSKIS